MICAPFDAGVFVGAHDLPSLLRPVDGVVELGLDCRHFVTAVAWPVRQIVACPLLTCLRRGIIEPRQLQRLLSPAGGQGHTDASG